tara:strand:+ start:445 stop:648 length:204 start_codon:yes stop_codon:yes gene_type:complete
LTKVRTSRLGNEEVVILRKYPLITESMSARVVYVGKRFGQMQSKELTTIKTSLPWVRSERDVPNANK